MIAVKVVVLSALVVALAVNAVAWQRSRQLDSFQSMARQYNAHHSPGPHWQMRNEYQADRCADAEPVHRRACLIITGAAI